MTYLEELQITFDLLDLIDVKAYIYPEDEVESIMRRIEGAYCLDLDTTKIYNTNIEALEYFKEHQDFFQGYVFNCIDEDDFILYCQRRYLEIYWGEEITVRKYVRKIGH